MDLLELLVDHLRDQGGGGGGDGRSELVAHLCARSPAEGYTAAHHAADMGAARAFAWLEELVTLLEESELVFGVHDKKKRTARALAEERGLSLSTEKPAADGL